MSQTRTNELVKINNPSIRTIFSISMKQKVNHFKSNFRNFFGCPHPITTLNKFFIFKNDKFFQKKITN
jgi:hypothetical protein